MCIRDRGEEAAPKGRIARGFRRLRDAFAAGVSRIPRIGGAMADHITAKHHHEAAHDPYQSVFYQRFRTLVAWCVKYRKTDVYKRQPPPRRRKCGDQPMTWSVIASWSRKS